MKKAIVVIGVLFIALETGSALAGDMKKDDFVKIWNEVRKSVADGDRAKWLELTVPAEPGKQITPEDFAKAKNALLDVYPDLKSVRFLKFDANVNAALFVLQTYLDDKNYITLDAFKFICVSNKWKLSGHVGGISFPSKGIDVENTIAKELKENKDLQLMPESTPAPLSLPATTDSKR
jgi:hypothetical protein